MDRPTTSQVAPKLRDPQTASRNARSSSPASSNAGLDAINKYVEWAPSLEGKARIDNYQDPFEMHKAIQKFESKKR